MPISIIPLGLTLHSCPPPICFALRVAGHRQDHPHAPLEGPQKGAVAPHARPLDSRRMCDAATLPSAWRRACWCALSSGHRPRRVLSATGRGRRLDVRAHGRSVALLRASGLVHDIPARGLARRSPAGECGRRVLAATGNGWLVPMGSVQEVCHDVHQPSCGSYAHAGRHWTGQRASAEFRNARREGRNSCFAELSERRGGTPQ